MAWALPASQFNIPNLPTDPAFAGGLYSLNFSGGLSQLGRQGSNPQYQYPIVLDPKVNYTRILGRHSLKIRLRIPDDRYRRCSDFHPKYGVDNYSGFFSSSTGSTSSLSSAQQQVYSVADFLFGARSHYELNNNPVAHLRQRMYFGYLQDDFKVSDKLTLNLGVRYEFATPQWERDNQLANFDPTTDKLIFAQERQPLQSRAGASRSPTTGRRASAWPTASRRKPSFAAPMASATCSSTGWAAKTCSPTTART